MTTAWVPTTITSFVTKPLRGVMKTTRQDDRDIDHKTDRARCDGAQPLQGPQLVETQDHLYSVVGRCTEAAWETLKALQDTPHFFEVVSALANKPGAILGYDIDTALAEVIRGKSRGRKT